MANQLPVVVVGIDGSEESGRALRWGAEYVHHRGGIVHAICVWAQPVQLGYRLPTSDRELEEHGQAMLDSAVTTARQEFPDVQLKQRLIRGHVVDELIEFSKQADLMVLGNKGHGAFTGMLVGSVAMKVVHHATCPVLVVR